MTTTFAESDACPCGTGRSFGTCCGPIHQTGAGLGIFAEQLMRARYTANVIGDLEFLASSWHDDTRPATLSAEPGLTWTGLTIVATEAGTGLDTEGTVTFEAAYLAGGEPGVLHERSNFVRVDGRWVYLDGIVHVNESR